MGGTLSRSEPTIPAESPQSITTENQTPIKEWECLHKLIAKGEAHTYSEILTLTKLHSKNYLHNNIAFLSLPSNHTLHHDISKLIHHNEQPDMETLRQIYGKLIIRINIMKSATEYKNKLGIEMADCEDVISLDYGCYGRSKGDLEGIKGLVLDREELFGGMGWGDGWGKGVEYLVGCLVRTSWDLGRIERELDGLVRWRLATGDHTDSLLNQLSSQEGLIFTEKDRVDCIEMLNEQ